MASKRKKVAKRRVVHVRGHDRKWPRVLPARVASRIRGAKKRTK